jgi:hypothetical protein
MKHIPATRLVLLHPEVVVDTPTVEFVAPFTIENILYRKDAPIRLFFRRAM